MALTVLAFTAIQAPAPMALAIRAGLGILLVAQGVGGWMIQHGVGPAGEVLLPGPNARIAPTTFDDWLTTQTRSGS